MIVCPTSKIHDFFLEKDGKRIRTWSDGLAFITQTTKVDIPGGTPHPYFVKWTLDNPKEPAEGEYTVSALFIASGEEATANFRLVLGPK